jgi:hypothetical protein
MNYTTAYAAGVAAAEKQMKAEGRTTHNAEDWNLAVKVMTEELMKATKAAAA